MKKRLAILVIVLSVIIGGFLPLFTKQIEAGATLPAKSTTYKAVLFSADSIEFRYELSTLRGNNYVYNGETIHITYIMQIKSDKKSFSAKMRVGSSGDGTSNFTGVNCGAWTGDGTGNKCSGSSPAHDAKNTYSYGIDYKASAPNKSVIFTIAAWTSKWGSTKIYKITVNDTSWGNNASGVNWGNIPDEVQNGSIVSWDFGASKKASLGTGATYNAGSKVECGIPGLNGTVTNQNGSYNCKGTISAITGNYTISFYHAGVSGGAYTVSKEIKVSAGNIKKINIEETTSDHNRNGFVKFIFQAKDLFGNDIPNLNYNLSSNITEGFLSDFGGIFAPDAIENNVIHFGNYAGKRTLTVEIEGFEQTFETYANGRPLFIRHVPEYYVNTSQTKFAKQLLEINSYDNSKLNGYSVDVQGQGCDSRLCQNVNNNFDIGQKTYNGGYIVYLEKTNDTNEIGDENAGEYKNKVIFSNSIGETVEELNIMVIKQPEVTTGWTFENKKVKAYIKINSFPSVTDISFDSENDELTDTDKVVIEHINYNDFSAKRTTYYTTEYNVSGKINYDKIQELDVNFNYKYKNLDSGQEIEGNKKVYAELDRYVPKLNNIFISPSDLKMYYNIFPSISVTNDVLVSYSDGQKDTFDNLDDVKIDPSSTGRYVNVSFKAENQGIYANFSKELYVDSDTTGAEVPIFPITASDDVPFLNKGYFTGDTISLLPKFQNDNGEYFSPNDIDIKSMSSELVSTNLITPTKFPLDSLKDSAEEGVLTFSDYGGIRKINIDLFYWVKGQKYYCNDTFFVDVVNRAPLFKNMTSVTLDDFEVVEQGEYGPKSGKKCSNDVNYCIKQKSDKDEEKIQSAEFILNNYQGTKLNSDDYTVGYVNSKPAGFTVVERSNFTDDYLIFYQCVNDNQKSKPNEYNFNFYISSKNTILSSVNVGFELIDIPKEYKVDKSFDLKNGMFQSLEITPVTSGGNYDNVKLISKSINNKYGSFFISQLENTNKGVLFSSNLKSLGVFSITEEVEIYSNLFKNEKQKVKNIVIKNIKVINSDVRNDKKLKKYIIIKAKKYKNKRAKLFYKKKWVKIKFNKKGRAHVSSRKIIKKFHLVSIEKIKVKIKAKNTKKKYLKISFY